MVERRANVVTQDVLDKFTADSNRKHEQNQRITERLEEKIDRIGDIVTCRPKVGGPFRAKVLRILVEAEDPTNVREVDVIGGYKDEKAFRTFRPDNITRLAQSRLDKGDEDEPGPTPARRQPRAEGATTQADARTCARHPKRRRKGCCLGPVA